MAISMITVITLWGDREEKRETNKMVQAAARIARHFTTVLRLIPTLIRREMSNDYVTRRKTKTPAVRAARAILEINASTRTTETQHENMSLVGDDRQRFSRDKRLGDMRRCSLKDIWFFSPFSLYAALFPGK